MPAYDIFKDKPVSLAASAAWTLLSGAIDASVTAGTMVDASVFPTAMLGVSQYRIRIDTEEMIVTASSGDDVTLVRGVSGTTAAAHADGASVYHIVTADALGNLPYLSTLTTRVANTVLAGPTTGADAAPTFRSLVAADIPDISATYATVAGAEVPLTFSTGLTRTVNTVTVNTSQNIATLSNLTSNGLVTTSGGVGTLGVTVPASGILTFLATPSSANLAAAVTGETGSGALVFATSPTLSTPSAPGSGTDSEAWGKSVQATGNSGTVLGAFARANFAQGTSVGNDAQVTGTFATAIGRSSRAAQASNAFGYAAIVAGINSIGIGNSATVPAASAVSIGQGSGVAVTETGGIAIGQGALVTAAGAGGGQNIAIGQTALASEWRATAIGYSAKASAISATAVGWGAFSGFTHAVAIGRGAWTNAANQIAIGFSGGDSATDVFFESGHTSKYVDWPLGATITRTPSLIPIVLHGFDAFDATGSPTNDIAGGNLILAAGRGTGTAAGGNVLIQTAAAGGSSNNTKNALVTRATFASSGASGIGQSSPAALWHLGAGTATANTAPLKFTSGTNLTTPEAGAMEYNGTNLFFTRAGTTREGVLTQSAVTTEVIVSDTSVTVNIGGTTYKLLARA